MSGLRSIPRYGRAAAGAVAALAVYGAAWDLTGPDWKLDEGAYAQAGWSVVHGGPDLVEGHPPLAKLLYGGAQLAFGRDDLAGLRSVAAIGFLASAAVLFAFGRRLGGWWTGVAAAGLFVVLPRTMVVGGYTVSALRIERHAILESIAAPLVLGALWAGWRWCVGDGSRWAWAAGAAAGLAACTKLSAVAVLVPILLVGGAFGWGRPGLVSDLARVAGAAVVSFLVPFLTFGTAALDHVGTVLRFPGERAEVGHRLVLGGEVWDRSPWWANLRYQWDADGPLLVAALVVGLLLLVRSRRRPAVAYLVVAVGVLLGPAMASPVALPHYRALWLAPILLLVALALVEALTGVWGGADARSAAGSVIRGRAEDAERPAAGATSGRGRAGGGSLPGLGARWAGGVAAAALVVLAGVGALTVVQQASSADGDYRALAREVRAAGVAPTKVLIYSESVAPYFPGAYDSLLPFDDGSVPAELVVFDPSLAEAMDPDTIERWRDWARGWGLVPHRVGRLEAWWAEP